MAGDSIQNRIRQALGQGASGLRSQAGGCVGDVADATLDDGRRVTVKAGAPGSKLELEGRMLTYLAKRSDLPVPAVLHAADDLLIMDFIESRGRLGDSGQIHAADLLADLHDIRPAPGDDAPGDAAYGLGFDTLIGGLHQPNTWDTSWPRFFADQRLRYMADEAARAGNLSSRAVARIDDLAARLDDVIGPPDGPSLIHGDVWGGNVLADRGRVAGFIDPAIYYADPEVELAFISLFGTFGRAFYDRYAERRGIRDGFFETRITLYNLYPLLVHARLFGGGYGASVESGLTRLGF